MDATTKGMYFNTCIKLLKQREGDAATKRVLVEQGYQEHYIDILDYPIEDANRLHDYVAERLFPTMSLPVALFELGKLNFDSFADGLIGKVAITVMTGNLDGMLRRAPKYYASSNKFGSVRSERNDDGTYRLIFRDYLTQPEVQHGIVTRAAERLKVDADVVIQVFEYKRHGQGRVEADFDIVLKPK